MKNLGSPVFILIPLFDLLCSRCFSTGYALMMLVVDLEYKLYHQKKYLFPNKCWCCCRKSVLFYFSQQEKKWEEQWPPRLSRERKERHTERFKFMKSKWNRTSSPRTDGVISGYFSAEKAAMKRRRGKC